MSTTASVPELRASSLKSCPRMAVYQALDAPAREFSDKERRQMFRGQVAERAYADWLQDEHPDWTLERQKAIPWEYGEAHADIYTLPDRILFEILSSEKPGDEQIQSKLRQLTLEMEYLPEADSGLLVILDRDMNEDRYPLIRSSKAYAELAEQVHARIAEVDLWQLKGELPDRVCSKPSDAIGHFCLHAVCCFDGWTAPPLAEIDNPDTQALAVLVYRAKESERVARGVLATAEDRRKDLEVELADHVPVGKHKVGGLVVTRTHVQRAPTLNTRKAELAGFPIPDDLWREGASYDTWRLDRIDGADIREPEVDYGTEAPF